MVRKEKMGIHDYVDFVQRNGQCLENFELVDPGKDIPTEDDEEEYGKSTSCGKSEVIFVQIPLGINRNDLFHLPLKEFAKWPRFQDEYSWDDWDFKTFTGYREVLFTRHNIDQRELTIWTPPGQTSLFVNFDPFAFDCFVLQKYQPEQIPYAYYNEIYSGRHLYPQTKDKQLLFRGITELIDPDGIYPKQLTPFYEIKDRLSKGESPRISRDQGDIVDFGFDSKLQKDSRNNIATFITKSGITMYVQVQYNINTNQIHPPK